MTARILLVEDDPVSRDLLASLLASKGYAVDTADDGFSGLKLAQDGGYDLVFADYHLPEMDGYAFARLMRSLSEKSGRPLKMVAITADRFGLAARRGVDAVFDKLLTKPIDPDALYECVAGFLAEQGAASTIDAFFGEPTADDVQSASQVLWRVRGIANHPKAAVFPPPSAAERQGLAYCFDITDADRAECLVVLGPAGLSAVAAVRRSGARYLMPAFGIGDAALHACDAAFNVGDPESWSLVAARLQTFAARTAELDSEVATTDNADTRLLAYVFVSDRPITLRRDAFGRTEASHAGGFEPDEAIAAIKRLAAAGLLASRVTQHEGDGAKELSVYLSGAGEALVAPKAVRARR